MSSNHSGFSLMELIVVVAILATLAGISIPYYNDYIRDARTNANKQNMATLRRAINDFRGDHKRGPFRGIVHWGGNNYDCEFTDYTKSELTAGVVPPSGSDYSDRRNKYLTSYPVFEDPQTGALLPVQIVEPAGTYFADKPGGTANEFDLDIDSYYYDLNGNKEFDGIKTDTLVIGVPGDFGPGPVDLPADVISVKVVDSLGREY